MLCFHSKILIKLEKKTENSVYSSLSHQKRKKPSVREELYIFLFLISCKESLYKEPKTWRRSNRSGGWLKRCSKKKILAAFISIGRKIRASGELVTTITISLPSPLYYLHHSQTGPTEQQYRHQPALRRNVDSWPHSGPTESDLDFQKTPESLSRV